jgi:peptidoglycan/LPS O-acetylase OafA/YrhL
MRALSTTGIPDVERTPTPLAEGAGTLPVTRERWPAVLAALAITGIVLSRATGWGWLSLAFPSLGVLFALGGSRVALALRDTPTIDAVGQGIRRLLPPLWLLGLIAVPVMLLHGWISHPDDPLNWPQLVLWVFPVFDPPVSPWGAEASAVLWYIRASLWFVLLTPRLLRALRRRPVLTILIPLALIALDRVTGSTLNLIAPVGDAVLDFGTYGACWMLGLAYREGMLRRIHPTVVSALCVTAIGLGAGWTATHIQSGSTFDPSGNANGQTLVCAGGVLLLLRVTPTLDWLDRVPVLGRLVAALDARVITIYLWHSIALALALSLGDRLGWAAPAALVSTTVVLIAVAVLAFGWAEDLAERRRPRLLPGARTSPQNETVAPTDRPHHLIDTASQR